MPIVDWAASRSHDRVADVLSAAKLSNCSVKVKLAGPVHTSAATTTAYRGGGCVYVARATNSAANLLDVPGSPISLHVGCKGT